MRSGRTGSWAADVDSDVWVHELGKEFLTYERPAKTSIPGGFFQEAATFFAGSKTTDCDCARSSEADNPTGSANPRYRAETETRS
jgi:hypothetical protein